MRKLAMVVWMGMAASAAALGQTGAGRAEACAAIAKLSVAQTEVVQAAVVEPGALDLHQEHPDPLFKKLPAFCRVVLIARPSADSKIKIEVWMPLSGWNGRFMGLGNGGFAGSIGYLQMAGAVLGGFATGGTDTGHTGGATDSNWALGHPEKVVDFGNRAVHRMTELSKTLVEAFYAGPAKHNYFSSCSDGGREALMEAQRYPQDYDGILAGAPAYNWTNLISRAGALAKQLQSNPDRYLPASKIPAINQAVLAACRSNEPGEFLADPRTCKFSPDSMVCKDRDTDACLTKAQADSVKALYAGSNLKDGTLEYHGLLPGGELGDNGWREWITGDSPHTSDGNKYAEGYFRNLVFSDPSWSLSTFDLDRDLKAAQQNTALALDAVNPDLHAFQARGGKLILYHGWNDAAISPLGTIDYYKSVEQALGQAQTEEFARLFLVPGMQHCGGGPGPAEFGQFGLSFNPDLNNAANNITIALLDWVEKGAAPDEVIARGNTDTSGAGKGVRFAEPICAYPKAAVYSGSGDPKAAASYRCESK
jgi:hypothetical protein